MCFLKGQSHRPKVSNPNMYLYILRNIFLPLLLIRKIEFGPMLAYELLADCPAFIDGQGCLCESIDYKPGLIKSQDNLDTLWWQAL